MWFWMNKAIRIRIDKGTLLIWILIYCCLDHDDMTWDSSKKKKLWKANERERKRKNREFLKIIGIARGTCNRKSQTLFWYNMDFKCCFGFFFNKTWDHAVIWIHVFNNTNKHKLLQWTLCSSFVEFFILSNYDEINYNIVSEVFYNVFWSANSGSMQ